MGNSNLTAARKAKNDEFYTRWADIEAEMNAYLEHNPDAFKGKTVLLPCDDPERSNFTKYFALNFEALGIKKLISTSYTPEPGGRGRIFVLERGGEPDADGLVWDYLEGDGDFRSAEATALRDEADMVITNPPFSLFRAFMAWLIEGEVEFSVIGNTNAVTYKAVFPLIKDGKVWPGASFHKAVEFSVPADYHAEKDAGLDEYGNSLVKVPAISWFTNIKHGRRPEVMELMTMEDNIRHSRRRKIREQGYPRYDNYDAIEVSFTEAIPSDYDGVMGVPISFLGKHNPRQFEIIGIAKTSAGDPALKTRVYTAEDYSNYSNLNAGPVIIENDTPRSTYPRILIRHKRP